MAKRKVSTEENTMLTAGIATQSHREKYTAQKYDFYQNPADGYIYWVKSADEPVKIRGVLHSSDEDSITAGDDIKVTSVTLESPDKLETGLFLIDLEGKVASFRIVDDYFNVAGIYHYKGQLTTALTNRYIVDDISGIETIPTNSMPLWLDLSIKSEYPIYSSFAMRQDLEVPYIVVDIVSTESNSAPRLNKDSVIEAWQSDSINLFLYNMSLSQAQNALSQIISETLDKLDTLKINNVHIALTNSSNVQDDFTLKENIKTASFEVNYNLSVASNIAFKEIKKMSANLTFED